MQFSKYINHFITAFLFAVLAASCASSSDMEQESADFHKQLVVVGGGTPIEDIRRTFLDLSPVQDSNLLIIPYAARESSRENSGQKNMERFKDLGVEQVTVLDLNNTDQALEDIKNSNLIWFSGGSQARLMSALEEHAQGAVISAIHEKVESGTGTPIGGSSAGAAVMSDVMIYNSYRDEDTNVLTPRISEGLALWPEVIVDQHFSERNRVERLEIAVRKNPDLTGVGIDEQTAVIYDGKQNSFNVLGEGTVTILQALNSNTDSIELEKMILESGDSFDFEENLAS